MKKKIISILILIGIIVPLFGSYSKVQAYSGEIDPQNYITLPSTISIDENKMATGTITLSSSASDYKIYYQKVDITQEKMDSIKSKGTELSQYISLIPDYTSNWQSTTNTTNNVKLDFSNYTGTVNFVLWVKIENGTNTYYNCNVYSVEIKSQQSNGGETTTEDWTDFSKATYELKKDGVSGAIIEISGVTIKTNRLYYGYISSTAEKPDLTKINILHKGEYGEEKDGKIIIGISDKVELNQDLYLTIVEIERNHFNEEIVAYGIKLERFSEGKYNDGFFATAMTSEDTSIITTFTHSSENNRKMQIKIGKITDTKILNKIKNQDSSGFANLLSYAKSSSAIYDEIFEINKSQNLEYNFYGPIHGDEKVIKLSGLENDAYYYLYVKTDDENGKYISNEAVTLGKADVSLDSALWEWSIFFYDSDDFKWTDFGSTPDAGSTPTGGTDTTIAPTILPKAGFEKIIYVGIGLMIIGSGIISYKKYKKYQGI